MKQFDQEQVRRIWQRVQSGAAYEPTKAAESKAGSGWNLRELIAYEMMEKESFLFLAKGLGGKNTAILRQMAKQAQANSAILRGIGTMMEGSTPKVRLPKFTALSMGALLRRSYGQTLQLMAEYDKRASDPQFGSVFQQLKEQKQNHCRVLLALLGSFPSK